MEHSNRRSKVTPLKKIQFYYKNVQKIKETVEKFSLGGCDMAPTTAPPWNEVDLGLNYGNGVARVSLPGRRPFV